MNSSNWLIPAKIALAGLLSVAVLACAETEDSNNDKGDDPVSSPKPETRYLPYSIKFDLRGNPVVVDEKGDAVKLEEANYPLKSTEIENIQSMTSVIYKGSCKMALYLGGKLFLVTLPDTYCAQL